MNIENKINISIVSPVYQAENIVRELVLQIKEALTEFSVEFEIILVNDGSKDNSWDRIITETQQDLRVKGINLSRNFGQHYAISAGLKYAKGEWVVVMDCDLQDRPDEIINLYNKAKEGWDIVFAKRTNRQDKILKRISSKIFYSLFKFISGIESDSSIANFGIYNTKVIKEYNKMEEVARSFPSLVNYLGFKSCSIDVKHSKRHSSVSTYSLATLISLAGDIIISNSNKPLKLAIKLGLVLSLVSFIIAFYNLISYFLGFILVPGFTTTVFSIWFVGGLMLTMLGVVGLYVGKIFNQVKGRQLFIVSEELNIEPNLIDKLI